MNSSMELLRAKALEQENIQRIAQPDMDLA